MRNRFRLQNKGNVRVNERNGQIDFMGCHETSNMYALAGRVKITVSEERVACFFNKVYLHLQSTTRG